MYILITIRFNPKIVTGKTKGGIQLIFIIFFFQFCIKKNFKDLVRCFEVITAEWVITPSANITRNYKGIR